MKGYLILVLLLALAVPALSATVTCGHFQNPNGTWTYVYNVTTGTGFAELEIGACDLTAGNYTNWVQPAGWASLGVMSGLIWEGADHYSPATPHGQVSPGPQGACPGKIVWQGPSPGPGGPFTFGFTHPRGPHDAPWWTMSGDAVNSENWLMAVGNGAGPVHSPVPEPGSLLALGTGLVSLAGMILRRRR
jgi:hypothetical protein